MQLRGNAERTYSGGWYVFNPLSSSEHEQGEAGAREVERGESASGHQAGRIGLVDPGRDGPMQIVEQIASLAAASLHHRPA